MAADNSLLIKIDAETKSFDTAVEGITKTTENLESKLEDIGKVSGIAFASLVASAGLAIHAFGEAQQNSRELVLALQNQGIASDQLVAKYKDLADAVSKKTGIDDDAIIKGQAVLQGFLGQAEITPQLTNLLADLSIKTGSVDSAAELLGRSLNGNVKGLKQYGISIDEGLDRSERMTAVTEKLSQKFGGLAESSNQGVASTKGLITAFGNFQEAIGERLEPAFTAIVGSLTVFFQKLNDNKPLLDFIVEIGKIAGIALGIVTGVVSVALAVLKLQQAFQIAQAALTAFGISSRVAIGATGIGLLLIVIGEIYTHWDTIWPLMQAIFSAFVNNIAKLANGVGTLLTGVFTLDTGKIQEGLSTIKKAYTDGFDDVKKAFNKEKVEPPTVVQDPAKIAQAKKQNEDLIQNEKDKTAAFKAEKELQLLQAENASGQLVDSKKKEVEILKAIENESNEERKAQLRDQLETTQAIVQEQAENELAREEELATEILSRNAEYQALSLEQRGIFLEKNEAALKTAIETEKTTREKAALDRLKLDIDSNNKALLEKQKYGAVVAKVNQVLQTQEVQGFQKGVGELTQLTQSKNAELKAIGKAAAVADITVKSAQAAINVYTGFSVIPFIGPALGIAGAAAAIAFGAEKIGTVLSAQTGGIVPGISQGVDSQPAILEPGELIVPKANFNETINAVASQRASQIQGGNGTAGAPGSSNVGVELQFSGDGAERFLTAKQVEARSLGTLRESS